MYHNLFVSVSGAHPCSGNAALKIIGRENEQTRVCEGRKETETEEKKEKERVKEEAEGERRAGYWSESGGEMKLEREGK